MSRFYVYAILVDGSVRYIGKGCGGRAGQHIAIARRLNRKSLDGQSERATHFHNRLAKHLREGAAIAYEIIQGGLSEADALLREKREIDTRTDLYNEKQGGEAGPVVSGELRDRLSAKAKERYTNPAELEKVSHMLRTVAQAPEVKAKRKATLKRQWADPAIAQSRSAKMIAGKRTPEARERMKAASKKAMQDLSLRGRISASNKKIWSDDERLVSRTEALKAAWKKPETIARHRAYFDSQEGRENLRRASQARWARVRAEKASP